MNFSGIAGCAPHSEQEVKSLPPAQSIKVIKKMEVYYV